MHVIRVANPVPGAVQHWGHPKYARERGAEGKSWEAAGMWWIRAPWSPSVLCRSLPYICIVDAFQTSVQDFLFLLLMSAFSLGFFSQVFCRGASAPAWSWWPSRWCTGWAGRLTGSKLISHLHPALTRAGFCDVTTSASAFLEEFTAPVILKKMLQYCELHLHQIDTAVIVQTALEWQWFISGKTLGWAFPFVVFLETYKSYQVTTGISL